MKKFYLYSLSFLLLSFLVNCDPDDSITHSIKEDQTFDQKLTPVIDTAHVVVRYPSEWSEADKKFFLDTMPVKKKDFDKCECGDPNLVQLTWDYDNFSSGEIQSAGNSLKGGPGGAQGDWPFTFHLPKLVDPGSYYLTNTKLIEDTQPGLLAGLYQTLVDSEPDGQKINIAIIDTGIDYYKNRDQEPFLYKTENLVPDCFNQASGWNFIFNTKGVTDDHGHGTYVTRLITSELQKLGIGYRILPIKAFNKKGEGKYWDIVCALSYIKELQDQMVQNKSQKRLHIVNASFGYGFFQTKILEGELTNYKNNSIAKELIDSLDQSISFIASAGNINNNVDVSPQENFPASFTSENIIGVGGYIVEDELKKTDGNFGPISIDVAAPYSDYNFDFIEESVTLTGSSYSAAYTSAKIAELIKSLESSSGGGVIITPAEIKANFYELNNGWIKIDPNLAQNISKGRYLD